MLKTLNSAVRSNHRMIVKNSDALVLIPDQNSSRPGNFFKSSSGDFKVPRITVLSYVYR